MKKTYMQPNSAIVRVAIQQLLSESLGVNTTKTLGDTDKGTFLGRKERSLWEDDEEY